MARTLSAGDPPSYPPPRAIERGLDLLFPPVCVGCRRVGRWICQSCWPTVGWHTDHICLWCDSPSSATPCLRCAREGGSLDGILSVADFDDLSREAVHTLKYHGRHAIHSMMGRLMAWTVGRAEIDLIAPVPLHSSRRRERGFDQAALLGREIARSLNVPFDKSLLKRTRPTKQQALLDADGREANVRGAFVATHSVPGKGIILVDDVVTTGATMRSAASALKAVGATTVIGLVFAHAR